MKLVSSDEDTLLRVNVRHMTALAAARPYDTIAVVGGRSIDVVLELLRCGFHSAISLPRITAAAFGERFDTLFICEPLDDEALSSLVSHLATHLATGGALVARLRHPDQDRVIKTELLRLRLLDGWTDFDVSQDTLVCHHLPRSTPCAAAA